MVSCCRQWGHRGCNNIKENLARKEVVVLGKFARSICIGTLLPWL